MDGLQTILKLIDDRLVRIEKKVDDLVSFKLKMVGAATVFTFIASFIIHLLTK